MLILNRSKRTLDVKVVGSGSMTVWGPKNIEAGKSEEEAITKGPLYGSYEVQARWPVSPELPYSVALSTKARDAIVSISSGFVDWRATVLESEDEE